MFCFVPQHEDPELAEEELDVGCRRRLHHHSLCHMANAASHEERCSLRGSAAAPAHGGQVGLTVHVHALVFIP